MKRLLASLCIAVGVISPAAAQYQVQQYSVPLGRGAGTVGFLYAAPGAAGLPLISAGASANPAFGQVGCNALPAWTGDVTKASGSCANTVTQSAGNFTVQGGALGLTGGSGSAAGSVIQLTGQGVTHLIGNEARVFGTGTSATLDILAAGANPIDFYTNSLKRMTIGSDGTVTLPYALNISGNPVFPVAQVTNPYFGSASITSQMVNATATSATLPETAGQDLMVSGVGGANPTTAFKIGRFISSVCNPGSADCYGLNVVGQLSAGVASNVEALVGEFDLNVNNANYGDAAGSPVQPYATTMYLATGGTGRASAFIMANCGANPTVCVNNGMVFWNGNVRQSTIADFMAAQSFANVSGVYSDSIINAQAATGAYAAAIKLANAKFITWRNGANTGDVNALALSSGNKVVLGSGSAGVNMTGTTTNDAAAAGNVGEIISTDVAASTNSLTTGTAKNLTSVSLTAGDWDCSGIAYLQPASGTTITQVWAYISSTANTLASGGVANGATLHSLPFTASSLQQLPTGAAQFSLASTTTVYLQAYAVFSVSTLTGGGGLRCRRIR